MATGEIVRNILAKFRIIYEDAEFRKFMGDMANGAKEIKNLALAYQIAAKAQQKLSTKQQAADSKQLTIENKKAALAIKQQALENRKLDATSKQARIGQQGLSKELKEVRLEMFRAKAAKYHEDLKKQKDAAKGLSTELDGVKESLVAVGVTAMAGGLFKMALRTEKVLFRIRNLIDKTALAGIQKRFDELNKQSGQIFSKAQFEESAAAVFLIDRNTRRFAKSLEFAAKMSPVLGKSLKEIQEGIARGVTFGDEESLIELGIITPLALEEMRRRTGLSLSDLRVSERENFIFSRLKLTAKQIKLAEEASKGLNASWNRFTTFISDTNKMLTKDFKPVAIFMLDSLTKLFRKLTASPVGLFVLRLGGLIAGLAGLALGIGAVAKVLGFLKTILMAVNLQVLILWAKFLAGGAIILGLILLIDDFWLSLKDPEADTIFNALLFDKFPKTRDFLLKLIDLAKEYGRQIGVSFGIIEPTEKEAEDIARLNEILAEPKFDTPAIKFTQKFVFTPIKNFVKEAWSDIQNDFMNGWKTFQRMITDLDLLFKGDYDWSNDELVLEFKRSIEIIEGLIDGLIEKLKKLPDIFDIIFGGKGSPGTTFPEAQDFTIPQPALGRSQVGDLISLIRGELIGRPGLRQLQGPTTSSSQVDQSTTISLEGSQVTVQAGLGRAEIKNIALRQIESELDKQLIEANIGGQ